MQAAWNCPQVTQVTGVTRASWPGEQFQRYGFNARPVPHRSQWVMCSLPLLNSKTGIRTWVYRWRTLWTDPRATGEGKRGRETYLAMPIFFLFTKTIHVHFRKEQVESEISCLPYPVPLLLGDLFQSLLRLRLVMVTLSKFQIIQFSFDLLIYKPWNTCLFHCEKLEV